MTDDIYVEPSRSVDDFRAGSVMSTAASILARNALFFLPITAVAALPIVFILSNILNSDDQNVFVDVLWATGALLFIGSFTDAVLIFATFQVMRGQRPSPLRSVRRGLSRFLPVLGTSFLQTICVLLGAICLLIPGMIVSTMLFLVIPACVVERFGPVASFARSSDLTRRYRWRIFGIAVAVGIIDKIVSKVIELVFLSADDFTLFLVANFVWTTIWLAYQAIVAVIAYHDLRIIKEGIDTHRIAAVFD